MMDIDLNLLRIFDILYDERNVTRAAARLFLTQSAVNHALAQRQLSSRTDFCFRLQRLPLPGVEMDGVRERFYSRFVLPVGN